MTPGVYLPPLPPESRLASILVVRPRCVPDLPGLPPLSIDPILLGPPIPYPAELLLPSVAPPLAESSGFR